MPKRQPISFRPRFAFTKPVQSTEKAAPKKKIDQHATTEKIDTTPQVRKSTTPQSSKKRATVRVDYLFPPELVERIDETWMELRKSTGRKLSKSAMMRSMISKVLDESKQGD
jgi:hypothetical protein